ncbi:DUF2877 domain-containing protein [Amphibacillus sp. Q70]|uniref:DUF2877 domain-containing protein n=1 Tax=Amphibacillus sp. Q70 TaxID=3453416 RepID=UPI003F839FEA
MRQKQHLRFFSLSFDEGFNEWVVKSKQQPAKKVGNIHSIFKRVINFQSESNKLYSILKQDLDNGPYSIRLATNDSISFLALDIDKGDPVFLKNNHLEIANKLLVNLETGKLWCPKKLAIHLHQYKSVFQKNLNVYHELLQANTPSGGAKYYYEKNHLSRLGKPNVSLVEKELEKRISYFLSCLDQEPKILKESVQALIGLGNGLTPSGDDFLTGFITVLNLIDEEKPQTIFRKLMHLLKNMDLSTTDISVMMIKASIEGRTRERLLNFINDLCTTQADVILIDSIEKVFAIGSLSGTDMATGMVTSLKYSLNSLDV